MFKNYLKIAWRNLVRNKAYTFIDILGFSLGIVCVLFILLWVRDEVSFDRFHENGDHLYRVISEVQWDTPQIWTTTPARLADLLREEIPEIQKVAKTTHQREVVVEINGEQGKEKGIHAEPDFLTLFTFPMIIGNTETALDGPDHMVISRRFAERYFRGEDPLGQTVKVNGNQEYRVTGVMENVPVNSSLQFDFLLPQVSYETGKDWVERWGVFSFYTYVQLHPDGDREEVGREMTTLFREHSGEASHHLFLEPVTEMYLYNNYSNGKPGAGRAAYVYLFSSVALFIFLIACINFVNLATARSIRRAKEVGVRKTSGAGRFDLAGQFIGEALLTAGISVLIALLLFELLLPSFNQLTGKSLELLYLQPSMLVILLGMTLVTGLLSGCYPAFFLSSLQPIDTLKGTLNPGPANTRLRRMLVVFQFTLTIILIIATSVVHQQIGYFQEKNLGYDRENLIMAPFSADLYWDRETLKEMVLQSLGVHSATFISDYVHNIEGSSGDLNWPGKPASLTVDAAPLSVGYDFLQTMGISLKAGRDFSPDFQTDSEAYIINETAARQMGMDEPVGEDIEFWLGNGPVIGVIEDFHFASMREIVKPLIVMLMPENATGIVVRTTAGETREAITALEQAAEQLDPSYPFEYHFMDELYGQLYRSEMLMGTLARVSTALVIFISCLGLFGLALFMAGQRTKEIGIRKVMGATIANIMLLLNKDFLKLVVVGFVIATPIAWYAMNRWLEDFAYRIELGPGVFLFAGSAAILIALATVSWQSVRAALVNPVESLRSE